MLKKRRYLKKKQKTAREETVQQNLGCRGKSVRGRWWWGKKVLILLYSNEVCVACIIHSYFALRIYHKNKNVAHLSSCVTSVKCVQVMNCRLCRWQRMRLQTKQMEAVALLVCRKKKHACRVKAESHNRSSMMGSKVSYDATNVAGCQAKLSTSNHLWEDYP